MFSYDNYFVYVSSLFFFTETGQFGYEDGIALINWVEQKMQQRPTGGRVLYTTVDHKPWCNTPGAKSSSRLYCTTAH